MIMQDGHPVKHVIDSASVGVAFATVIRLLPDIAALFSIIWSILRIYEMGIAQRWWRKLRKVWRR